jgi:hypothetical protein
MIDFESLLDGEEHNLVPGVDFGPLAGRVVEWVPVAVQPKGGLLPGESPVVNWVNSPVPELGWSVESGWAAAAVWLKALSDAYGVQASVYQINTPMTGDPARVQSKRFVFQRRRFGEDEF